MTDNQKREEISKAYISAVAAQCGCKIGAWSQDDGCLDLTLARGGLHGANNVKIDLQLKATNKHERVFDGEIRYSLRKAHYDKLRAEVRQNTHLLVLLLLAENEEHWVSVSPESLQIKRCAYYIDLAGFAAIEGDANSTTVVIPRKNVFTPESLNSLFAMEAREVKKHNDLARQYGKLGGLP